MQDDVLCKVLNDYCGNGMLRLKKMCFPLITLFGGITDAEYDEFYSIANETVWTAALQYNADENDSFDNFLRTCLLKKFMTFVTKKNRKKRIPTKNIVTVDSKISEDSDKTFAEIMDSGYRIDDEIFDLNGSEGLAIFISGLSKKQVAVVELLIKGYEKRDIMKILNMTEERYNILIERMKTIDNRILLTCGE